MNVRISLIKVVSVAILLMSNINRIEAETNIPENSYIIHEYGESGFFANFCCVLGALDLYEHGNYAGLTVQYSDGTYYDPRLGHNWWNYFFEPILLGHDNGLHYTMTQAEYFEIIDKGSHLPRHRAKELIKKYIHIKPKVLAKFNDFKKRNMKGYYVIGVHHRGTDKIIDFPLVKFEDSAQAINDAISTLTEKQRKKLKIYVATDDQNFLNYMINLYPKLVIYGDFVRSHDDTPLYGEVHPYKTNFQKGEEALLESLKLSACNYLVRPKSSLSIVAGYFNPDIPVKILNEKL